MFICILYQTLTKLTNQFVNDFKYDLDVLDLNYKRNNLHNRTSFGSEDIFLFFGEG